MEHEPYILLLYGGFYGGLYERLKCFPFSGREAVDERGGVLDTDRATR
jgi:hypothetical protein